MTKHIYFYLALFYSVSCTIETTLNPVILVPGDGGTQLMAKLNQSTSKHWYCSKHTNGYFNIWVNLSKMFFTPDCVVDNLCLVYDNKTHTTSNTPGVDIGIEGWGDTRTVEYLDPGSHLFTPYFAHIVSALVSIGYTRNVNIRGAPYDFRKAPNEMSEYFKKLKDLVEETFYKNNNTKIIFIAHSMGNPVTLYFLNHQSQQWKDKFIQSYIGLSGVWGGVIKSMRLFASGDHLAVFFVNPLKMRKPQRTMTSTAWLIPSDKFWKDDEVLVQQPKRNYTVKNYKEFFSDLGIINGYSMRKDTENLIRNLTAPGVEFHCLHGVGKDTPGKLVYSQKQWPDSQPSVIPDKGDGTVNIRSLLGCLKWKTEQKQAVYHQQFEGDSHMSILKDKNVIAYIKNVVHR